MFEYRDYSEKARDLSNLKEESDKTLLRDVYKRSVDWKGMCIFCGKQVTVLKAAPPIYL